jgi:hypothetical protein
MEGRTLAPLLSLPRKENHSMDNGFGVGERVVLYFIKGPEVLVDNIPR